MARYGRITDDGPRLAVLKIAGAVALSAGYNGLARCTFDDWRLLEQVDEKLFWITCPS